MMNYCNVHIKNNNMKRIINSLKNTKMIFVK